MSERMQPENRRSGIVLAFREGSLAVVASKAIYLVRRFLARSIDYILYITLWEYILNEEITEYLALMVLWASFIPIEALSMFLTSTTPGKALVGLYVKSSSNFRNSFLFVQYIKRSFLVWLLGVGAGLPLVSIVAMAIAFARYLEHGTTYWDKIGASTVRAYAWFPGRRDED